VAATPGIDDRNVNLDGWSFVKSYLRNNENACGTWAVVPVDPSSLRIKTKPINVSIPERTLATIDRFAERHGWSRSALMVSATCEFIDKSTDPGDPPIGRRRVKRSTRKSQSKPKR
jgi:hypothetical protein